MKNNSIFIALAAWFAAVLLASCGSSYEVSRIEGGRIAMDSAWDARPDAEATALVTEYKVKIDSVMNRVIGRSKESMDRSRPEDLLSNLVADVLRDAAESFLGKPVDMGLINVGGLRNVLSAGDITCGNVFEILPFDNSLCLLTMKGRCMKSLMENIAARKGEGVSGVHLEISKDGRLLNASVGGKPIEDEQLYTVATVDYLAEGNDGMTALLQAEIRLCPDGMTLRDLFMKFVEGKTAKGEQVSSRIEGRIQIR